MGFICFKCSKKVFLLLYIGHNGSRYYIWLKYDCVSVDLSIIFDLVRSKTICFWDLLDSLFIETIDYITPWNQYKEHFYFYDRSFWFLRYMNDRKKNCLQSEFNNLIWRYISASEKYVLQSYTTSINNFKEFHIFVFVLVWKMKGSCRGDIIYREIIWLS